MRITVDQSRAGGRDAACAAAALGAQYLDLAAGHAEAGAAPAIDGAVGGAASRHAGRCGFDPRQDARHGCSARTKPTRAGCSATTAAGPFKDGINDYVVDGDRDAVECRRARHQMRGASPGTELPPGRAAGAAAALPPGDGAAGEPFADFDAVFAARIARGRRVLRRVAARHRPTRTRGWCSARRWPACCGPSSSISFDVRRWLTGDPAQPPPPASAATAATPTGGICNNARHHLDAGHLGISLVCRLGPRPSMRDVRADRSRSSPRSSLLLLTQRMVHASERPAAGL